MVSMQALKLVMSLCSSNWACLHNSWSRVYVDVSVMVKTKVPLWIISWNMAFRVWSVISGIGLNSRGV